MLVFLYLSGILGLVSGLTDPVARQYEKFSRNLLINIDVNSNILISPLSAFQALSMLYFGAESSTRRQLRRNLIGRGGWGGLVQMNRRITQVLKQANRAHGISLTSTNNVFAQRSMYINQDYQRTLKGVFDAPITRLNFGHPQKAAMQINQRVHKATRGLISNVVNEGDLGNSQTQMVLVNTLYFNGRWKFPFEGIERHPSFFFLSNGLFNRLPIKMMFKTGRFKHIKKDDLNLLELPYQGDQLVMECVWPATDITKALNSVDGLRSSLKWNHPKWAKVFLPRFKMEASIDLKQPLSNQNIQIQDMFNRRKADFRGINNRRNLFVGKLMQKVVLDVDTEGTKAAAATTAVMSARRSFVKVEELRVNEPFLVYIRHKTSNLILFKGLVRNPSE